MAKSPSQQQSLGQFFTPDEIATFILKKIKLKQNHTISDISCGDGAFINIAFDKLKKLTHDEISTVSQIYGIELSPSVLQRAHQRISAKCDRDESKLIIKKNIVNMNTITSSVDEVLSTFPLIKNSKGFDVIVGNPPYVTIKLEKHLKKDPSYRKIIAGQINITTLIIGRSYSLLKNNGQLGLLLPKSLFRVESYQKLRNFILKHFEINYLVDVGMRFNEVRGEQVILIATKKTNPQNKSIKVGLWKKNEPSPTLTDVSQKYLTRFGIFQIYDNVNMHSLVSKIIGTHSNLDSICDSKIHRGISLGANSPLVSTKKVKNFSVGVRGDSIKKFGYKYLIYIKNHDFSDLTDEMQGKKIISQNIFSSESGIVATYDEQGLIPLNTITNIFPTNENPYYVLGILNSILARFFMIFVVFAKSRLTMHTDRHYIGLLPIPKINSKLKNKIIKQVKSELDGNKSETLDDLVFSAFDLLDEEKQLIKDELLKFERDGKKSI